MPRYMPSPLAGTSASWVPAPLAWRWRNNSLPRARLDCVRILAGTGGVLVYGIRTSKCARNIVDEYIAHLQALGVKFVCNTYIGKDVTIDDMLAGEFDAVFVGTGAGVGNQMEIEGETLQGVYSATEFLVRGNLVAEQLPEQYRESLPQLNNVVVIGGAAIPRWTVCGPPCALELRTSAASTAGPRPKCLAVAKNARTPGKRASASKC